jgi:hypothetical protein
MKQDTSLPISRSIASSAALLNIAWQRIATLDWAYAAVGKRDARLDLLRGFAVFAMVVDHIGGASWLYPITGANRFWFSAAEGFVVLSGLVFGMVYGGIALKEGLRAAQIKAIKRAFTLYKLTIGITFISTIAAFAFGFGWAQDVPMPSIPEFIFNVLTLRQVVYLTDIPLMYTLFLAIAPLGLWLLHKGRTDVLMLLSGALWVYAYTTRTYLPWTIIGGYSFNLGSWQLLFFSAMAMGYHWDWLKEKLGRIPRVSYLLVSTTLFVWLINFYNSDVAYLDPIVPGGDTNALLFELFRKSVVGPGRLLATVIVFQFAYLVATMLWKPLQAAFGWLLVPLGQNSLYGYTMHVALIGVLGALAPYWGTDWTQLDVLNTSMQVLCLLVIWAMVRSKFLFRIVPR